MLGGGRCGQPWALPQVPAHTSRAPTQPCSQPRVRPAFWRTEGREASWTQAPSQGGTGVLCFPSPPSRARLRGAERSGGSQPSLLRGQPAFQDPDRESWSGSLPPSWPPCSSVFTQRCGHSQRPRPVLSLPYSRSGWKCSQSSSPCGWPWLQRAGCRVSGTHTGGADSPPVRPHGALRPPLLQAALGPLPRLTPRLGLGESHPLRSKLPFDSHRRRWSPSICLAPDLSGPVNLGPETERPDTCTLSQEPRVTAEEQQGPANPRPSA